MDFELTPEQSYIRQVVREYAQAEIAPKAAHYDETSEFPYEWVEGMARLGLFALPFPESVGGVGGDCLSYALAMEEIARADASAAITLEAAVSLGITPFVHFGTKEQQERWLPSLMSGRKLWAFGLTEPDAGSDAGGTETRAVRDDGHWVINGRKVFITNAGTDISAGVTLAAVTSMANGVKQISTIAVERGTPGYTQAPKYRKLGWRASDTRELMFDDVRVPLGNIVGDEGAGYRQFLHILEGGRVAIAALAVGVAQACLDAAVKHAAHRRQFGRPIATFQAIQFKLADMATQIELARLMTWRAACAIDAGQSPAPYASMAKLHASEVATACASQAVQIHGGYGFMDESPVARYYRDVKASEIGEGTSEVQRLLVARHVLRAFAVLD
jgi:short/branched chain acyl-CoA dehydrogenase